MAPVTQALKGLPVFMLTESAADVGLSIVSDKDHASRLVTRLHTYLFHNRDLVRRRTGT